MAVRSRRRVRVRAFAKLNLTLRVLGRRPDGYHELRTTFQSLALHDTLTFTAGQGPFTIACRDPECPRDDSNLIWRAAERLCRERPGRPALSGVEVALTKRIPSRAGLGGGSSDAAAALRALALLWRVRVEPARLREIAAEVGADVPFFIEGGSALGLERGDVLFPLIDQRRWWVVIARPAFGVSTKDAFAWWDDDSALTGAGANDLEPIVTARHPEIARLGARLRRAGAAEAAMSGSGSAVFGLFNRRKSAEAAARALANRDVMTLTTRTLDRAAYQRLSVPVLIAARRAAARKAEG
jgi:4-diphosphocytidyl-2-C-methyl-D-erythritol kinase